VVAERAGERVGKQQLAEREDDPCPRRRLIIPPGRARLVGIVAK
jgi:hypothetical protein